MARQQRTFSMRGVVEGFYGRVWTPAERFAFIEALWPFGLNAYLYAPKHEPALAAELMEPLAEEQAARLGELARFCTERGVRPLVGLHFEPPLDPSRPAHLEAAASKCRRLAELGFSGFAVLYDDLQAQPVVADPAGPFGGSLAAAQAHAFTAVHGPVARDVPDTQWLVCPSRYTLDEMLEREYGPFEPDYLARLDAGVPGDVAFLWTGPKVCATTITPAHLAQWRGEMARPVAIWDNYPVNDAAMVHQLHLGPLRGRAPELADHTAGYLFNPMLQPALGAVPGATCLQYATDPDRYDPAAGWVQALAALLDEPLHAPFAELEALTRRSCLEPPPAPLPGQAQPPLADRLREAWQQAGRRGPVGAELCAQLDGVLTALRHDLPATMRAEAIPWLERMQAVQGVLCAADDAQRGAAEAAFRAGEALVLPGWSLP